MSLRHHAKRRGFGGPPFNRRYQLKAVFLRRIAPRPFRQSNGDAKAHQQALPLPKGPVALALCDKRKWIPVPIVK
jgi:hypothetical protein